MHIELLNINIEGTQKISVLICIAKFDADII